MEQLLSISKIFSEKIFRIPDYQRGYAWTIKEIEDFWGDLCRLEDKKNHYVGVLTLEPAKIEEYKKWVDDLWIIDAKRYTPYYIVDGQQRLTTSIILIYVILEIMKEKKIARLNYTSQDEISRKYIYEYKDENRNRTYMYGYEIDNPSYEYLISQIYDEKIISFSSENETIYTNNLGAAKKFFYDKLIKMTKEDLEVVYTKITQHFLFNMYIISDDIDVFVTFETMNNRGKPLSNLELLKNRLIYVSTMFKVDEHEKVRLRRDINQCWKKIYHILGKGRERILLDDEFLVTHFMLYFAKTIPVIIFALFAVMLSTVTRNTAASVSFSMALYMGNGIVMLIINQFVKKDWVRFVPFNNLNISEKIFSNSTSLAQMLLDGTDTFAKSTS